MEGFDDQWVELSCGVAFEPSEGVEVGSGPAGAFGDVGPRAGIAEQPVDGDQVRRGVGLAIATAGEPRPAC